VHIKFSPSPEAAIVEGDDGQLQQALLNLCLNARDAMPNGGVLVVECAVVTLDEERAAQLADGKPGEYVMMKVTDSGTGIPPEIRHRVFEPLFTTKEPGKGTGLGLSVVYGIVRSHNGHLTLESEVDSGTIFTMFFPKSRSDRTEKPEQPRPVDVSGGSERILIIEDEISVGQIGTDILTDLGYTIELAENGRDAIDKLKLGSRFDLAILDMNMPRMGGLATYKQIKELCPSLKVLVCSGYSAAMLDDREFAKAVAEFARKVRTILDTPPVRVPARRGNGSP
jgi:two-component system NtrC family sensor kinase